MSILERKGSTSAVEEMVYEFVNTVSEEGCSERANLGGVLSIANKIGHCELCLKILDLIIDVNLRRWSEDRGVRHMFPNRVGCSSEAIRIALIETLETHGWVEMEAVVTRVVKFTKRNDLLYSAEIATDLDSIVTALTYHPSRELAERLIRKTSFHAIACCDVLEVMNKPKVVQLAARSGSIWHDHLRERLAKVDLVLLANGVGRVFTLSSWEWLVDLTKANVQAYIQAYIDRVLPIAENTGKFSPVENVWRGLLEATIRNHQLLEAFVDKVITCNDSVLEQILQPKLILTWATDDYMRQVLPAVQGGNRRNLCRSDVGIQDGMQ